MVAIRSLTTILTYLIGLCGILPLFPWLTLFPRVILVAGVLYGLWQDRRGSWQLKSWMQNLAIVPVFFYYALQFTQNNPVQPVTDLLAVMLAVRLSGEKSVRHTQQIFALSMFCLASSTLFDLTPLFLLYLGLMLFLVAIALVLLTFQNQDNAMTVTMADLKKILLTGLLMPLLAVPLLLFFFPILPRTQMPLWHFLATPLAASAGYSEAVEPGSQSSIAEARKLAFRAEMPRLAQSQLYWRGTVFNHTDGNKWTRKNQAPSELPLYNGQTVTQVIYPEPTQSRTLIALDRPVNIVMPRMSQSPDGVFENWRATGRRVSYAAGSQADGIIVQSNMINRRFYLQLPERLPNKVKALAAQISRTAGSDRAKVELLESYFRNGGYRYSMRDLPTGNGAIENFLFGKKQGHCEFFASSFALLLRAAAVPCRLVGGYLGGDYNELGGYYLVTDARAHVWVEAYIEGRGWVRIDPSSFAVNAGDVWAAPGARNLLLRISLVVDSLNYLWNRAVVSYDFEQQMNIANRIGSRLQGVNPSMTVRSLLPYLAGGLLIAVLLFAVQRLALFQSREKRILCRFLKMVGHGGKISTGEGGEGLFEIAAAADNGYAADFVRIYAGAVYHDRKLTDQEYRSLQQTLLNMKRGKPKTA